MSAERHPVRTVPVEALGRYMRAMLAAPMCYEENASIAAKGFLAADNPATRRAAGQPSGARPRRGAGEE